VVHPSSTVAVYLRPGGKAIAALPSQEAGTDTWVPVINQQADWAQVMLPARPNGATGWIYLNPAAITERVTPYRIVVDRETFTLTLLDNNVQVGRWTVGVGLPQSVTPVGRTFILASIEDPTQPFSPIILPLGIHSDTYTDYSGGPGTIGIHGWPSQNVYDQQSSHGCIRVPPQALAVLSTQVPIGTPVLIS
jgi:lipoprotein-anchoring transpeptidase ErfK/SrfK